MMFKYILVLNILLLTSINALPVSKKQFDTYKEVVYISSKYKDNEGYIYPSVMASICLTESSLGKHIIGDLAKNDPDITKGSLGIMQVRVDTAKFVGTISKEFSFISKMSDLEIAKKLLSDNTFNIGVATTYFIYNKNRHKTIFRAISTYNGGLKNMRYVKAVFNNLKLIKKIKLG